MTHDFAPAPGTPYIEWAKLQSGARFTLATSGMAPARLADLGARIEDLDVTGDAGYGYPPLVERIAARFGVAATQVVCEAGTSGANFLAMAALVEPGDEVVIERPTYEPLLGVAAWLGARVRRFDRHPADGFAVDTDRLGALVSPATRLVVLANLHNPSSALIDDASLVRIGEIAARVGARVLVDEVYLDAVFDPPQSSAARLGPPFLATGSLTKICGLSGLRCGWILAEPALATRLWRLRDLLSNVLAHPAERLSVMAFDRLPALLARARARLDENRRIAGAFFATRPDLSIAMPPFGTTLAPRWHRDVTPLCRLLRERYDTTVVPGHFFELPDHVRIGLGGDPQELAEGLRRLGLALDEAAAAP
jgi:hypothetical protein